MEGAQDQVDLDGKLTPASTVTKSGAEGNRTPDPLDANDRQLGR
jgi:hypothetical protein